MNATPDKISRILVASDLSDQAGLAIERGLELGIEHGAEVVIVHIVDESLPPDAQSYLTTVSDHDIRGKLARHPHAGEVTTTIDIVSGRPDIDILERAEIEQADLIVVGLHERLLEENLPIQGTVVEQIILGTHLPVLVVKNKPRGAYRSVAVGVDFSVFSQEALRLAAMLAPAATLHLVHAYESAAGLLERFRDSDAGRRVVERRDARLEQYIGQEMSALEKRALARLDSRPQTDHVAMTGDAHEVLKSQAAQFNADLVAVGTHGRVGLARAFLGSVATEILNDRQTDVLVVRPF